MATKWHTKIEQLRLRKGHIQERVAAALGISQSTYSAWENGRVTLDERRLERVLSYHEWTMEEFMHWEPGDEANSDERIPFYIQVMLQRSEEREEKSVRMIAELARMNEELLRLLDGLVPRGA